MTRRVEYTHHDGNINSSVVKKVWYASPSRELFVETPNGVQYGYRDVSPVTYDNFLASSSKGRFYNENIKRKHKSTADYGDVQFLPAPGLDRNRTDARRWASSTYYGGVTSNPPVSKPKKNFQVTGTVLRPQTVREIIAAESLEDAIAQFRARYADKKPEVTGVAAY